MAAIHKVLSEASKEVLRKVRHELVVRRAKKKYEKFVKTNRRVLKDAT